jgi:hypothetical protein
MLVLVLVLVLAAGYLLQPPCNDYHDTHQAGVQAGCVFIMCMLGCCHLLLFTCRNHLAPPATTLVCSLGPSSHMHAHPHHALSPAAFPAATKLVCSLGPSSHSVAVLEDMLRAGMVAARIDLTWGGLDFHRATLAALNVGKGPVH